MGAADASRRFAHCSLVVGSLPSRRLAVMSLIGNISPPLIMLANSLQSACVLLVDQLRRWVFAMAVWCRYLSSSLVVCPPHSAATPTAHPGRVDTRNEICLTANEILLRKVKFH